MVKRSIGLKKIRALKEAANRSIGIRQGSAMAKLELRALLEKYEFIQLYPLLKVIKSSTGFWFINTND